LPLWYTPNMETQKPTEPTKPELQNPTAEVPTLNPLAEPISHFEDDPFWDEMMDSIRRHRREMDATWDTAQ